MSKGEQLIKDFLDKQEISYIQEKRVGDTRMRFDFYLDELNIVIEYQGAQHYKPIQSRGGWKAYEYQLERDARKREYCRQNCIGLIEVPHYVPDVIDFLERRLKLIEAWRKNPA